MTIEAPAKQKQTWRDWENPNEPEPKDVLTRDELVGQLQRWREDVTERDLRLWEYRQLLPRPIRRSHRGAVRVVYPPWFPPLVRQVRRLQRRGHSLEQIKRRTRAFARYVLGVTDDPDNPLDAEIRALANTPNIEGPEDINLPDAIRGHLAHLAQLHERLVEVPTDHLDVWVCDAEGNQTNYRLPIATTPRFVSTGPPRLTTIMDDSLLDVVG